MTAPHTSAIEVTQQAVTVAQEDRDFAAQWIVIAPANARMIKAGDWDHHDGVQAAARHRLASISSASAEGIKTSAEVSLMYLQTGFVECPQCGEEVPTKTLDAAYELATVVEPAPTIGGTVRPEPVPATNQAGEVATFVQLLRNRADSRDQMGYDATAEQIRQAANMIDRLAALATQPATSQEGEKRNCFGIPDQRNGWTITQGPDDRFYATIEQSADTWNELAETLADKYFWQVRDTCSRAEKAEAALLPPTSVGGEREVDSRFWQQAIGNEIARQCGIGAGTCGNANDGSGLFEVDASLDLNGFAAAMGQASLATVAAANDEGVVELRELEAKATRGEWSVAEGSVEDGSIYIDADDTGDRPVAMIMSGSPHDQDRADAAFIIAAVAFARAAIRLLSQGGEK